MSVRAEGGGGARVGGGVLARQLTSYTATKIVETVKVPYVPAQPSARHHEEDWSAASADGAADGGEDARGQLLL